MSKEAPITLSPEESDQLIERLLNPSQNCRNPQKCQRNYMAGLLMLDAGLRVGEVVKLLVEDLVFEKKPCSAVRIRAENTKTHFERTVPVTIRLKTAIVAMFPYWCHSIDASDNWYAIMNVTTHKPLTVRQLERIIQRAGYDAFGRAIHPHRLRHTFATRLIKTTNTRIVQTLLGHKSLSSTQIYTHPTQTDRIDAIRRMEEQK